MANRLAIAGMVLLVLAMVGVMLVITDVPFGSVAAAVATAAVSGFFLYGWFLMPIRHRLNEKLATPEGVSKEEERKMVLKVCGVRSQELVLSQSALHHG